MTGFAGAGANGVGAQIIKSTDGGVTWAAPGNQSASFNIYLDAKAESSTHAVRRVTTSMMLLSIKSESRARE